MDKEYMPDFSGKCISMRLVDSDCSHDLVDPKFEVQAGRLFIVGIIPEGASESNWDANQLGAVAWEQVRNYTLFDNLASYQKAVAISESYQEED
ncbi:hypothetical protein V1358_11425 [Pseudoalteromonas sp. YIC-656]|uniref:hypothetical protein n=1 Tax=Pseudoalteromonas TaxID=53246 RepID=UPI001BAEA82A|nr:hypothetical protein [Pseudoalteromonas sp. BDTF-M6]MBS3797347.1 hypothetical protein [Pseudoalteromonas sp. BDTF-M6]